MLTIHWTSDYHGTDPEGLVGNHLSHMMVVYSVKMISIAYIKNAGG